MTNITRNPNFLERIVDSAAGTIEIHDAMRLGTRPLVSILILAYNHEPYLAKAIDGILMQDVDFPIEIVIGEDNSTDGTLTVARRYLEKNPETIRIITSAENVGAGKNFLRIFRHCRGEILAICEGDDYWTDPAKLARQVAWLRAHKDVDITFHACHFLFGNDNMPEGPYIAKNRDHLFSTREVISGGGGFMPTASIVVRRKAVEKIPVSFLETSPMGDFLIQVYGSLKGGAYYFNNSMSVYRRGHANSWSLSMNQINRLAAFENDASGMIMEMAGALPSMTDVFNGLVFRYCFQQFLFANYKKDKAREKVYLEILKKNRRQFTLLQRTCVDLACRRRFMLPFYASMRLPQKIRDKFSTHRFLRYV